MPLSAGFPAERLLNQVSRSHGVCHLYVVILPETIPEIFRRISGDKAAIRIDDPISGADGLTPLFF